jgi:cyanobactin maturation PatA/PatG family protease
VGEAKDGSNGQLSPSPAVATIHDVAAPVSPVVSESDSVLGALRELRNEIGGDPEVCVAVLDGPVDLNHPCFRGANATRVDTLVQDEAGAGAMSAHGTHVASVIFGQPLSGTLGVAPRCRGLFLPIFRDSSGYLSQLDLARAIERAVLEGADIINVSGGERAPRGEPDPILERALSLCDQNDVLVVAATGNDGCDCLHVPAAVPSVLAVGAMDRAGRPVESSNFGEAYRSNGVLAPGDAIPGAVPGGGIAPFTGSSFATPVVSGLAALLMSAQRREHGSADRRAVRSAILESAISCEPPDAPECARYLAGTLDVRGAYALTTRAGRTSVTEFDSGQPSHPAQPAVAPPPWGPITTAAGIAPSAAPAGGDAPGGGDTPPSPGPADPPAYSEGQAPAVGPSGVEPACSCGGQAGGVGPSCSCGGSVAPAAAPVPDVPIGTGPVPAVTVEPPIPAAPAAPVASVTPLPLTRIFAIGNIGFDFGTEARRDTFRQLMPRVESGGTPPVFMAPNPYDTTQLADYLDTNPSECTKLIWTLNLDLTPIYAVEAEVTYADEVYKPFRTALRNQALPADKKEFVSRVSIPGVLTTRTVRLFSGQVVPVVVAQPRGLYVWNETELVNAVVDAVAPAAIDADNGRIRLTVRQMLDKVYYQLRNLGQSPPDRAINFQATNAFVFTEAITRGLLSGDVVDGDTSTLYSMDTITAIKSPYCRVDSDCWDVQISFFDPENDNRARVVFQSTIDVSDELPVQLAPTHQFLFAP